MPEVLSSKTQTLWDTYQRGYQESVNRQAKRGHAPQVEIQATPDLVEEITKLVDTNLIDMTEAKKLAKKLGKLEYGEWGLTGPRIEVVLREILGTRYSWQIAREFSTHAPHGR